MRLRLQQLADQLRRGPRLPLLGVLLPAGVAAPLAGLPPVVDVRSAAAVGAAAAEDDAGGGDRDRPAPQEVQGGHAGRLGRRKVVAHVAVPLIGPHEHLRQRG